MRCRFPDCPDRAIYVVELEMGCACFPEDRVQLLCAQHANESEPLGTWESRPIAKSRFAQLCEVAARNHLAVELMRRQSDDTAAIFVVPELEHPVEVGGTWVTCTTAVVGSPFWIGKRVGSHGQRITAEGSAPQLIGMLAERGYR